MVFSSGVISIHTVIRISWGFGGGFGGGLGGLAGGGIVRVKIISSVSVVLWLVVPGITTV